MNVTCDKCSKRYVISDDKVAGKASVKIRCKQCQNLISITVTTGAASGSAAQAPRPATGAVPAQRSPWEEESTRAMPPLDTTTQWFAMLGGKQQGPFDLMELHRRATDGEVTLRTYLWKAGMGDWKRASDVPEVSAAFAGGATAPAPAPQPPPRLPTRERPAAKRDVALSNEVPSPGNTNRPTAQSGAGAVVNRPSSVQHQPLNDLFGDVSGIHDVPRDPKVAAAPEPQTPAPQVEQPHQPAEGDPGFDPFAALSHGDGQVAPPVGEATRFFIAQAGVNKRNPPWKIALFVMGFIVGPIALLFVLNTLEIVSLPTVTRTNENGEEVQESFFSAGGAAGMKDLLTGDAKKRRAESERQRLEKEKLARARILAANTNGKPPKEEEPEVVVPRVQDPGLAAFYAQDDRKTRVPKVRGGGEENAGANTVNSSGLTQEAVAKVVADKSKAFQLCIDAALRRNPNLSVGNVTVVLNVGPSGAVKSAGVEPKKHETTDWGQCMMSTGKRIVFPGSDAETQVELPFKVGVAMTP